MLSETLNQTKSISNYCYVSGIFCFQYFKVIETFILVLFFSLGRLSIDLKVYPLFLYEYIVRITFAEKIITIEEQLRIIWSAT